MLLGVMISIWRQRCLRGRLLLLIALLSAQSGYSKGASLFESSKNVQELNASSFHRVLESKVPWVIDCYSPGCPHCVRFKSTWERVGETMRNSAVHVGAVNCTKHRELCQSFKVHGYPSLVAVNWPGAPESTPEAPSINMFKFGSHSFDDTMANIETAFPGLLGVDAPVRALEEGYVSLAAEGGVGDAVWRTRVAPCALRLEDAAVSVRWILRNDVFTQGLTLSDKRMGALLSFLDLLATTFPGKINRLSFRTLASELRNDPTLNSIASWDKRLDKFQIGFFVPDEEPNWRGANMETGTEAHVNHLTSGLWSLFHALSLSSAPRRQDPHTIMENIRSFVENFFRCEYCRSHFLAMYEACENHRCDIPLESSLRGNQDPEGQDKLALWVWRMHNAVNARLAREGDEETELYKSLWPSAQDCRRCWEAFPPEKDQPPWSEPDVLQYLAARYSCPDAVVEGSDSSDGTWAIKCVAVVAAVSLLIWARRKLVMRGVGLSKKSVDTSPGV